jgi:hypothetical protein
MTRFTDAEAQILSTGASGNIYGHRRGDPDRDRFETYGDDNIADPDFTEGTMYTCEGGAEVLLLLEHERSNGFKAIPLYDVCSLDNPVDSGYVVLSSRPFPKMAPAELAEARALMQALYPQSIWTPAPDEIVEIFEAGHGWQESNLLPMSSAVTMTVQEWLDLLGFDDDNWGVVYLVDPTGSSRDDRHPPAFAGDYAAIGLGALERVRQMGNEAAPLPSHS